MAPAGRHMSRRSGEAAAATGRGVWGAARHRATLLASARDTAGKGGKLLRHVACPTTRAGHARAVRSYALQHLETPAALTTPVLVQRHYCPPQPVQRESQTFVGTPSGKTSSV